MHNGGIAEFDKLKRRLQADLSDAVFLTVQGNTGVFTPSPCSLSHYLSLLRLGMGIRIVLVQSTTKSFDGIPYLSHLCSFQIATRSLSRQRL